MESVSPPFPEIESIDVRIDSLKNFQADIQYQRLAYFAEQRYLQCAARIAGVHISNTARLQELKEELAFYARWHTVAEEYLEYLRGLRDTEDTNKQEERQTKANNFLS